MAKEYDAWGRRAPRWLNPVFGGRRKLTEWLHRLEVVRGQLMLLGEEPFSRWIDVELAKKHLEAVRSIVIRGLPFMECDCDANTDCPECENQRWVNIDRIPEDFRKLPP